METIRDRQKSYAYVRHRALEFEVRDYVLLRVSVNKGIRHFSIHGKLALRWVEAFKIIDQVGKVP